MEEKVKKKKERIKEKNDRSFILPYHLHKQTNQQTIETLGSLNSLRAPNGRIIFMREKMFVSLPFPRQIGAFVSK